MFVYHVSPNKNRESISRTGIRRSKGGIDGPGIYVWVGDLCDAIENADISLTDSWDGDETKLKNLDVWRAEISDDTPTLMEWEDYIVLDIDVIPASNIVMIGDFLKLSYVLSDKNNASNNVWHPCTYEEYTLYHDGTWVDGRWYEWLDKFGNKEAARMKIDAFDHFYPPTKIIKEEDVIAFRELPEVN